MYDEYELPINQTVPLINGRKKKLKFVEWIKHHKLLSACMVISSIILMLIVICVPIFLTLNKLKNIQFENGTLELTEVCNENVQFKYSGILRNPCSIEVTSKEFDLSVKDEDGTVVAVATIPSMTLKHGKHEISFESYLNVYNEPKVSEMMLKWVEGVPQRIISEFSPIVRFGGIDYRGSRNTQEWRFGGEGSSKDNRFNLKKYVFKNNTSPDTIIVDLQMQYVSNPDNSTTKLKVQVPLLDFDLMFQKSLIATVRINSTAVTAGQNNSFDGSVVMKEENVNGLRNLLENYLGQENILLVIQGSSTEEKSKCLLKRLISKVNTTFDVSDWAQQNGGSSFQLESLNVEKIDNTTLILSGNFTSSLDALGNLDNLQITVKKENGSKLMYADLDIDFNPSIIRANVSIVDFQMAGEVLTNLTAGFSQNIPTPTRLVFTGRANYTNLLSRIFTGLEWESTIGGGDYGSSSFKMKAVSLYGKSNNESALIGIDFTIDTDLGGSLPALRLAVLTEKHEVGNITLHPLQLHANSSFHTAVIGFNVLNATNAQNTLTDLFQGQNITLVLKGVAAAGQPSKNVIDQVLEFWSFSWNFDMSQNGTGPSGGVFPHMNVDLVNTTSDNITAKVELEFDVGLPDFTVNMGQLDGHIEYKNELITEFHTYAPIVLSPRRNKLVGQVSLFSGQSKPQLEEFVSKFLFGKSIDDITFHFDVEKIDSDSAQDLEFNYTFNLPPNAGGNKTSVIECVSLASMDYSLVDILLMKCSLETLVDAYFHNPLSFPISLNKLTYDVYFNNTVGAVCAPVVGCYYPPKDDIFFAHVEEPGNEPPEYNPLPITIEGGVTNKTVMKMKGFSNELCFRLHDQYEDNKLAIAIKNGTAVVQIEKFIMDIKFEMDRYPVPKEGKSCPDINVFR